MFTIPRVNVIESDRGFSVKVVGKSKIHYTEGDKTLAIEAELLAGPSGLRIFVDSIRKWSPPHDSQILDQQAKQKIIQNIRDAFRFRGLDIQIS